MKQIKLYSKDELLVFSELLGLTISAHHNDYGDFLGEIAGEAALLSKRGGQFFTPYSLCQMMAKMSFGSVKSQIEEKGVLTVCEPAVGAGALVIASAEEVASQGVNPCAHLQFDCTDVSRDAFNMAYIQLSALGLQAIVHHGNTLSMEIWESRPTLQLRMFDQWLESKREEQRLVQSMQSLLAGTYTAEPESWDSGSAGETSSNQPLFDLEQFSGESSKRQRSHQKPDVVLDRQMNLFG
ncbi:MAG: N-6 DNA methylase [Cyanobacteria bacterium P01_D01_bin.36]